MDATMMAVLLLAAAGLIAAGWTLAHIQSMKR